MKRPMSILAILAERGVFFARWRRFSPPTDCIDIAIGCIAPSRNPAKNKAFRSCDYGLLVS
jgi:hypothetical protein